MQASSNVQMTDFKTHIAHLHKRLRARSFEMRETLWPHRVARLATLEKTILKYQKEIVAALSTDFHKPEVETLGSEILPVIEEIHYTSRNLRSWMKPEKVGSPLLLWGTKSAIQYEPYGVVLVIAPWNYPFHLLMRPLISAIGAGNSVFMKPSELTPATAQIAAKIISEVFAEDEVCVVTGGVEETQAILDLKFDYIFFTGSPFVGRIVMEKAARTLTPVTLELGGKSPAIFDKTAKFDKYVRRLMYGKFLNAGQTCVAPDYVYVHESGLEAFLKEAKVALESFYQLKKNEKFEDFCRIINSKNFARLSGLLNDSVSAGAKIEFGGKSSASERLLSPTLVTQVKTQMPLMKEEIFGPILPIMTFEELDEVIGFINQGEKPLSMYIFSEDDGFVQKVLKKTSSGAACINQIFLHLLNPKLPFGGVGQSGIGSYHGRFGFRTFSHAKSVLRQSSWLKWSSSEILFPPYTGFKSRFASKVIRYFS